MNINEFIPGDPLQDLPRERKYDEFKNKTRTLFAYINSHAAIWRPEAEGNRQVLLGEHPTAFSTLIGDISLYT